MNTERVYRLCPVLTRFVPGFPGRKRGRCRYRLAPRIRRAGCHFPPLSSLSQGTLTIRLALKQCWVMTSGPGLGKTTIVKAINPAVKDTGLLLCALMGV
jgi:hypothetical protein